MGFELAESTRLGFIGAGQMAEAIARGLVNKGVIPAHRITTSDISPSRQKVFQGFGVSVQPSNADVAANSDVLIVAVKPQYVPVVLSDASSQLTKNHLVVSIAAGVALKDLESWAGGARVVRVMPNTPCLVGETAAALSPGTLATTEDVELVKGLFSALGQIHVVKESLLNAVTGLSGSGPAYVFIAIEALADGGVAAGLPRDVARSLAAQTVLGAAKMVIETGKHPGQLKDEVASPAGTTIAGIHELEKAGFRAALMNAVIAATKRGDEMSG
ncbi:pyrroline-5-carboxylate reductase [Marchantia polymorpha subsp. ruderalis]|uniref:Pyrroline-5-carboxylate reductase n=2 Tax=Marchantia polymorpha TaxID=3197 RepID=A0AAF6AKE8_MARPO|nr:hypothetical protein MARPO_0029s0092 [Marchantia polymorpha]BBM96918.1 hypothetical protein Mp_1g01550 [Marchantia polymorpha subsp. ruderalis]|eukprot:PTQ42565.1 hypothetical protein MARPO_0029s0092 [Marchantia polymorpha]